MHFTPLGDQAVTITLGDRIDEATHRRVRAAIARLELDRPSGLIDLVTAFASVTVHYDAARVGGTHPYDTIVAALEQRLSNGLDETLPPARTIEIPVCYGGDLGPDLDDVARAHGLSADAVVRIHAGGDYLVYMVGFMPGFAYLGGLSAEIATPRRSTPRTAVPTGSVGIGGQQTGVYPCVSPGGWNLIGRTPRAVFDTKRAEPSLLATGDHVRFLPITRAEYEAWTE